MQIKKWFKPRPNMFVELLKQQGSLTLSALTLQLEYLESHSGMAADRLDGVANQAVEVRRQLVEKLQRTFVTPFDREDIYTLSRELDEIIDYARNTVDEMQILRVAPTEFMVRMAALLKEAGDDLVASIEAISTAQFVEAHERVQRARLYENRTETVYREALADLFHGAETVKQVMNVLKVREIYRHLSNAADRTVSAANVLANIIMKIA